MLYDFFVPEENISSVNNALNIPGAYPLVVMAVLNQFQSKTSYFSYFSYFSQSIKLWVLVRNKTVLMSIQNLCYN